VAVDGCVDAEPLARVCVEDGEAVYWWLGLVERGSGRRITGYVELWKERLSGEGTDDWVLDDQLLVVEQVAVHDVLLEGEETENGSGPDFPPRRSYSLADLVEFREDGFVFPRPVLGDCEAGVSSQLLGERRVDDNLFVVDEPQSIRVSRRIAAKFGGDQDEWGGELLATSRVHPVEEADCEVKDTQRLVLELAV
jgi:hypothetical protein